MNSTWTFRQNAKIARLALLGVASACAFALVSKGETIDFNRDILPVLSDNCFKCHGPDEEFREADLRLDTRDGATADLGDGYFAIVPGNPSESEVVWRINADDEEDLMPPKDSNLSLSPEEKERISQWIAEGAEWKNHWSFEPVVRPELPKVEDSEWSRNGIDRFVLARLEEEGIKPAPEAEKETLIRRLSLDLTGLPPTPEEVDQFLGDDSPDAYERLVDRLLASHRYGETMALPWLDAARYADTDGYQNDGPREMWRWRDWVIDAYNQNKPFDEFTIEQLAGDLLPNPSLDQIIATGFNRNHRYNSEAGIVFEEFRLENAVDRVDTASTVWMGLTMGCARCHDHKYDPISTKEYYQLISYFNSIPESGRAKKFGNSEPWILSPTKSQFDELARKDAAIESARDALEKQENEWSRTQALWEANGSEASRETELLKQGRTFAYSFDGNEASVSVLKGQPWFGKGVFGTAATVDGESSFNVESEGTFASEHQFSVSFWVKPDSVEEGVILSRQDDNQKRPGIAAEFEDGHLQFYIITRWIAGVAAIETLEKQVPGEWMHVALVNDGTKRAQGMRIFVNGKRAETRILHNSNSNDGQYAKKAQFRIGGGVFGADFEGQIDELRIYTRELWDDEIAILAEPLRIREIALKKPSQRSVSESSKLRAYYLENEAPQDFRDLYSRLIDARIDRTVYYDSLPTTMIMQELPEPRETFVRKRGVYNQFGEKVERKLPEAISSSDQDFMPNRLGLAQWLVNGEHPLTGRVAANRYWLKYFGRGLVKTAEDFGIQGERPSHPELLDWLADEFVRLNWDVKAMQKLIVTSATYRQSSRMTPDLRERDPGNILLARGPRERLSSHATRDQALAVSGLLVEKIGGPSVSPYQPDRFWELLSNMKYKQSSGEDLYRRSLYTIWKRTIPPPSMAVLDAADRESCIVSTKRTNTPLQALALLNEKAFVEAARNFGQRILLEGGDSIESQVEFAFRSVTGRYPSERERAVLYGAYREYKDEFNGEPDEAHKFIRIGESKLQEGLDPIQLAAATTFANVLLNLDEVITKE